MRTSFLVLSLALSFSAVHAAPSAHGASTTQSPPRPVQHLAGWSAVGNALGTMGPNGPIYAIAVGDDDNVYVAGNFTRIGDASTTGRMIARWDGSAWTAIGSANDWILTLAIGPDGALYAGGLFTQVNGVTASRVARWDGAGWSALGSTTFTNPVNALVVDGNGVLYAGGGFNFAGEGPNRAIARWDGAAWAFVGGGVNGTVYSLAVDAADQLYVGGTFDRAGTSNSTGGVEANSVARWDGASWSAVGSGVTQNNAIVYALEVGPEGALYAGGTFTEIGGATVNGIGRWDGVAWAGIGGGVTGSIGGGAAVLDIVFDGTGVLYIGGSFAEAGGTAARGVARWTGAAWEGLGGGVTGEDDVEALAVGKRLPTLYAVGAYTDMDGNDNLDRIAQFEGGVAAPTEPGAGPRDAELVLEGPSPNPIRDAATIRFIAQRTQVVRLEVFDALGRRVALLYDGPLAAAQTREVRFDGREFPAGAYVLRLSGEGGQATRRVTFVR